MAGLGRHLGSHPRGQVEVGDVVDGDLDLVLVAPIGGKLVEPGVVVGDEVAPLQDPELFLARGAAGGAAARGPGHRTGRRGSAERHRRRPLHEAAPADLLLEELPHSRPPISRMAGSSARGLPAAWARITPHPGESKPDSDSALEQRLGPPPHWR